MPAYNFQKQFAPMILDGSKWHTVRPRRKNPTKPGDKLMLYIGQRTKQCEKIMDTVCSTVVPIAIHTESKQIVLNGRLMPFDEMQHFALHDGFENYFDFFKFFERYSEQVCLHGLECIYWRKP